MTRNQFWQIIETCAHEQDLEKRNEILIQQLSTKSADEIISFETTLRQVLDDLDHSDIVAIQRIIMGFISDDAYLYFRCWIISNGEKFITAVIANGDSVLEKLNDKEVPSFEDLLYVATMAFGSKVGKEEDDSFPRSIAVKQGLDYDLNSNTKGETVKKTQLKNRFPKLWQHCRVSPPEGSMYDLFSKGGMYDGPSFR